MTIREQLKIKKENTFKLKNNLISLFRRISKDLKNKYISESKLIDLNNYNDDFRINLKNRMLIVANQFKNHFRKELKKAKKGINQDIENKINENILDLINYNTDLITTTNIKQLNNELQTILDDSLIDNSNTEMLANELSDKFFRQGVIRSDIISEIVVQQASESSKETEVSTMIETGIITSLINDNVITDNPSKEWVAIIDKRTRPAHINANGQTKNINEDFLVDGERLSYPSDPRGSIGNIARCRCTVNYNYNVR